MVTPHPDLGSLDRSQRRALFDAGKPKKASTRIAPNEAAALCGFIARERFTGMFALDSSPYDSRRNRATIRLFDRGLVDVTHIRDDGFLQFGFPGPHAEMEAHRLLATAPRSINVLGWCLYGLRGSYDRTHPRPITVPIAVSILLAHYASSDTVADNGPIAHITITRHRATSTSPRRYRFAAYHHNGTVHTYDVEARADTNSNDYYTDLLDEGPELQYGPTPKVSFTDRPLAHLGWILRTSIVYGPYNPSLDDTYAPDAALTGFNDHGHRERDVTLDVDNFTVTPLPKKKPNHPSTSGISDTSDRAEPFDATVPRVLADALTTLEAPPLPTANDFITWAEATTTLTVSCGGTFPGESAAWVRQTERTNGKGAKRHTLHLDPHTHQIHTVTAGKKITEAATAAVEAEHLLWAMTIGAPNGCDTAFRLFNTLTDRERLGRYTRFNDSFVDRVHAVRTVARAVAYLEAGLTLNSDTTGCLVVGLPAEHTASVVAAIAEGKITSDAVATGLKSATREGIGAPPTGPAEMAAVASRILNPDHDYDTDPISARDRALYAVLSGSAPSHRVDE